jgi:hypothetical protein
MIWLTVTKYWCHKWPWICSAYRKKYPVISFMRYHRVCIITIVTRRAPLVEQVFFNGIRVARSLVFCVVFCRSLYFYLCHFYFGHCIFCPSSMYVFWLPLQTLLVILFKRKFKISIKNINVWLPSIVWTFRYIHYADTR